jgi:hypothetical protein
MTTDVLIFGATVLLGLAVIRYRLKGFYDGGSDRPESED